MSASPTVLPEKATHQQTRTFNQQLVLRAMHAADVFRAGSARDEVAVEIPDREADHLARASRSLPLTLAVNRVGVGGDVAAAGPAVLEPIHLRSAREPAASPAVQAALDDPTLELPSPTEAPGARGAAEIARHRIGLPEREGVGER